MRFAKTGFDLGHIGRSEVQRNSRTNVESGTGFPLCGDTFVVRTSVVIFFSFPPERTQHGISYGTQKTFFFGGYYSSGTTGRIRNRSFLVSVRAEISRTTKSKKSSCTKTQ